MPSDIVTTSWSETDASNSQFPPEGWPAGMFPNAVEPSARMNMGAVKRFWNRVNPVYAATLSTTDTFVVSPAVAIGGYGLRELWRVRFPSANTATSPTVNISSIGPQLLRKYDGAGNVVNLSVRDVQAQDHEFWWDGSQLILTNPAKISAANLSDTIAATSWTPADGSGAGLSLTVNDAQYYKLGKLVFIIFNITYPSTADSSTAKISGLPVAPYSPLAGADQTILVYDTAGAIIAAQISNSTSTFQFRNGASPTAFTNSSLSGQNLFGSGVYLAG